MEKITVRQITMDDLDALQEIGKQTFAETFSTHNSEENMTAYLDAGFSKERLQAELTDPNAAFYFAELDGNSVGYLGSAEKVSSIFHKVRYLGRLPLYKLRF